MKYLALFFFFAFPLISAGSDFDFASYENETLDNIVKRSNVIIDEHGEDKGIEILNPSKRVALTEELVKLPYKCSTEALTRFMKLVGFEIESLPPINYCIEIRSKSGVVATFYVQDSLVGFINEEVKLGDSINLWALWVFSDGFTRLPFFLVNSYEKEVI
jgi:hypothetical protein